uniref:Uncharacterized protein n=2 Tax=Mustela putorius furo TaxID=9669 RepID=M3YHX7_MUSPF
SPSLRIGPRVTPRLGTAGRQQQISRFLSFAPARSGSGGGWLLPSRRLLPAAPRTPRSVSLVEVGGAAPVRAEPSDSRSFLGPFKLVLPAIWGSHDNNGGWGTRAGSGRSACAVRGRRSTSSRVAGAAVAGSLNRGRPRLPVLGHGPSAAVQAPEVAVAVAAAAAERGAVGFPGPRRARRRERCPRAEPSVRGLSRVRVYAACPAGPSEDRLQPGLEDRGPPAAGRAPGPVCLLACRPLRPLIRHYSPINKHGPHILCPVFLFWPPEPICVAPRGSWCGTWF